MGKDMVRMVVPIERCELVDAMLNDLDQDQIFKFITDLDDGVAEWEFTNRLFDYFTEMRRKYEQEELTLVQKEPSK